MQLALGETPPHVSPQNGLENAGGSWVGFSEQLFLPFWAAARVPRACEGWARPMVPVELRLLP